MTSDNEKNTAVEPVVATEKKTTARRAGVQDFVNNAVRRRKAAKATETGETGGEVQLQWYIVQVYSGFEQKVKMSLEERIRQNGMEKLFGEIKVPQEEVTELVRGQKKNVNRKFFPGYILVQMLVNEDTWHLIKNTPKVNGFLGDSTTPLPMSPEEVTRLTTQMEEGMSALSPKNQFSEGDAVKVKDGPFQDFTGTVEEVKPDKAKVKVLISIFGRATPVELDFFQVERI